MKQSVKRTKSDELPPCTLHLDCQSSKDGVCTVLSATGWSNGKCPFYKTREEFMEGCRVSLIRLLEQGRTDLLAKYGCMEAYAAALKRNRGNPDEAL